MENIAMAEPITLAAVLFAASLLLWLLADSDDDNGGGGLRQPVMVPIRVREHHHVSTRHQTDLGI